MPRGDRRGPEGAGAMTGRGLGYCSGNNQPGFRADAAPHGAGRGLRNGAGRGPGFGRGQGGGHGQGRVAYYASAAGSEAADLNSPESREREITRLENIANTLSSELEIVKNKIDGLKNS